MCGNIETMPPRRCLERDLTYPVMEREMRELHARLDSMETTLR
jgi:hypothetical protein